MATLQQFFFCDNSTFANYSAWASYFNVALISFTWIQTNDTGQVMWSGMNITANAQSGSTAVFTYNSLTGLPLAIGRALTITGMTNAGNNKTVVITSFTGTTSGTITCTLATGVTEAGSTGVVTIQTTVPGSGAFFYEIWVPNDGSTAFFARFEYGNSSGTNSPAVKVTLGTTTNGAGTLTGFVTSVALTTNSSNTANAITTFECDFSGAAGRFTAMLWRNAPSANNCQQAVGIERSVGSSGSYNGNHVTVACVGHHTFGQSSQQTLLFGVGPAPSNMILDGSATTTGGFICRVPSNHDLASTAFNGAIPLDTIAPNIGFLDYSLTMFGLVALTDLAEGVAFASTVAGSSHTYMPSSNGALKTSPSNASAVGANNLTNCATCMRYD